MTTSYHTCNELVIFHTVASFQAICEYCRSAQLIGQAAAEYAAFLPTTFMVVLGILMRVAPGRLSTSDMTSLLQGGPYACCY